MKKVEWAMLQALNGEDISVCVRRAHDRGEKRFAGRAFAFDDVVSVVEHPAEGLSTKVTIEECLDAKIEIRPMFVEIVLPGTWR